MFAVGGASRGLGLAVARELVAEGARVLLVARGLEALDAAAAELGDRALPCAVDLADPADAGRIGGLAAVLGGGLDGVLVNVGTPPGGEALELTDDEWLEAFDVTLRAPLASIRSALPLLEASGGSILFLTSSFEPQQTAALDASNVLRPALAALFESLARTLGPGIRVNSLASGRPDTGRDPAREAGGAGADRSVPAFSGGVVPDGSDGRGPRRLPPGGALIVRLLAAMLGLAAVLVVATPAADGRSGSTWRFVPDAGVRLRDAVSAEVLRRPDGSLLLWANTPSGIAAYRSRDGLAFRRAAGRMPLGAHPTVVTLPSGRLRMYYATEAALPLHPSEVRSAVSGDGLHWFLENGKRFADAGFGVMEVVRLPDGGLRLYLNDRPLKGASRIVSARSTKGITFHHEPGIRLPEPYVDPAVVRLDAGRWLMAVSTIQPQRRQRLFLADSSDGLDWSVQREPLLDDPAWSVFDPTLLPLGDGRYRLFYTRSRGRLFELRSGILSRG